MHINQRGKIMLEFMGLAIVIYIAWVIIKGAASGALRATMTKAVEYASGRGVPRDEAQAMVVQREVMKSAIQTMGQHDPKFRMLDVYVQYGEAIIMMWKGYQSEQGVKR